MEYESVNEAVEAFMSKHKDVVLAIQKAQIHKNNAKSKIKYEFWLEVELELKKMKPKKATKWD